MASVNVTEFTSMIEVRLDRAKEHADWKQVIFLIRCFSIVCFEHMSAQSRVDEVSRLSGSTPERRGAYTHWMLPRGWRLRLDHGSYVMPADALEIWLGGLGRLNHSQLLAAE